MRRSFNAFRKSRQNQLYRDHKSVPPGIRVDNIHRPTAWICAVDHPNNAMHFFNQTGGQPGQSNHTTHYKFP